MSFWEHARAKIFNPGQHPLVHDIDAFGYINPRLPNVKLLKEAIDYIVSVLYPNYIGTFNAPADLPGSAALNDYALVIDDGDGLSAGYVYSAIDNAPQWIKRFDADWTIEHVLTQSVNHTAALYVHRFGLDDTDASGSIITGQLSGQQIYGGVTANTNLTLHANSGNAPGAHSGYIQLGDATIPLVDALFDLGSPSNRFATVYALNLIVDAITTNALTIISLITGNAAVFGDPALDQAAFSFHRFRGTGLDTGSGFKGNYGSILLDANGSFSVSARKYLLTSAYQGSKFAIIGSDDATTDPSLGLNGDVSSGSPLLVLDQNGALGLGIPSPQAMLDVSGVALLRSGIKTWVPSNISGVPDLFAANPGMATIALDARGYQVGQIIQGITGATLPTNPSQGLILGALTSGLPYMASALHLDNPGGVGAIRFKTGTSGSSPVDQLTIDVNGAVTIGHTGSTEHHTMNGDVSATGVVTAARFGAGVTPSGADLINVTRDYAGPNQISVANATDNPSNVSTFHAASAGVITLLSSGAPSVAATYLKNSGVLETNGSSLNLVSSGVAGTLKVYIGGNAETNVTFSIASTGAITLGASGSTVTHVVNGSLSLTGNITNGVNTFLSSDFFSLRDVKFRDAARTVPAQTGDALFYDAVTGTWRADHPDTEINHTEISGLTLGDSGHTQFVMLSGRAGGQVIQGGSGAGENLFLESTSNPAKGQIILRSNLYPEITAVYVGTWSGTDLGSPSAYFRNIYTRGEFKNFRFENFLSGAVPAAAASNAGRAVFLTDTNKLRIDNGGAWIEIGAGKFIQDTVWNGTDVTKDITVSGIIDARNAIWQFCDNSNDYERIFCSIRTLNATTVRISVGSPLPAGSYRLIGME